MLLFLVPAIVLLRYRHGAGPNFFMGIGAAVIFAGALYRFSTYIFAFNPGPEWSYIPALPEIAVTVGLVAGEIMGYLFIVKTFPILRGVPPEEWLEGAEAADAPTPAPDMPLQGMPLQPA